MTNQNTNNKIDNKIVNKNIRSQIYISALAGRPLLDFLIDNGFEIYLVGSQYVSSPDFGPKPASSSKEQTKFTELFGSDSDFDKYSDQLPTEPPVYNEVATHADIYMCQIGLWENSRIFPGNIQNLKKHYPGNIIYNAVCTGKYFIHNLKYTDPQLQAAAGLNPDTPDPASTQITAAASSDKNMADSRSKRSLSQDTLPASGTPHPDPTPTRAPMPGPTQTQAANPARAPMPGPTPAQAANPAQIPSQLPAAADPAKTQTPAPIPINVPQGYTRCCCLPVDDRSFITSDRGIAGAMSRFDTDVLLIEPGHVKLPGFDYGFIGGCAGNIIINGQRTIIFNGDISAHPDYKKIADFIEDRDIQIVYFEDYQLEDIGSILTSYI